MSIARFSLAVAKRSYFLVIIYDIETAKNALAESILMEKSISAPSNYKDQAKIDAYIQEARHKIMEKAALCWTTARIVSIATRVVGTDEKKVFFNVDERQLLIDFFEYLKSFPVAPKLVGKNNSGFDDGMCVGRAIVHDIGIVQSLHKGNIDDIDQAFGWSKAGNPHVVQLGQIALALSYPVKTGHGTQVQAWMDLYELGDDSYAGRIMEYNMQDVDITHEFYRRYMKSYISTTPQIMEEIDGTF